MTDFPTQDKQKDEEIEFDEEREREEEAHDLPHDGILAPKVRHAELEGLDTGNKHDHGELDGLSDNDHPQYIEKDGTTSDVSADIPLNNNKLTGVKDPTDNQDAATKKYVDDEIDGINKIILTKTAGEAISKGDVIGLGGAVEAEGDTGTVTQGASIDSDNGDTNNQTIRIISTTIYGLVSFTNLGNLLPAGATPVAVKLYWWQSAGASGKNIYVNPLRSSFDKATVTWNTKPTYNTDDRIGTITTGANETLLNSDWLTVTETLWEQIVDYGILFEYSDAQDTTIDDEDDSNPMYIKLKYKLCDGKYYKTDATDQETADSTVGIATADAAEDAAVYVQLNGEITVDSWDLDVGTAYYLQDTAGALAKTAGSVSKKIGIATSTTTLLILNGL